MGLRWLFSAPVKPSNCDDAVRVLTQLLEAYGDDPVIVINAEGNLACPAGASVGIQPALAACSHAAGRCGSRINILHDPQPMSDRFHWGIVRNLLDHSNHS